MQAFPLLWCAPQLELRVRVGRTQLAQLACSSCSVLACAILGCANLTRFFLKAAEVAAAAIVSQSNELSAACSEGCAVLGVFDARVRNTLKEARTPAQRAAKAAAAADDADEADDDVEGDSDAELDEEEDEASNFPRLVMHHTEQLALRYGVRFRCVEGYGDAEYNVAAIATQLGDLCLAVAHDADVLLHPDCNRVNLQAKLARADAAGKQAVDGRTVIELAAGEEPVGQLAAHGMAALTGDYLFHLVEKNGQNGPKKLLKRAFRAERAALRALTTDTAAAATLPYVHAFGDALVAECSTLELTQPETGEVFSADKKECHISALVAAGLLRLSLCLDADTLAALKRGELPTKRIELDTCFLMPRFSLDSAAPWNDQVVGYDDMLAQLKLLKNKAILDALDHFHNTTGGLEQTVAERHAEFFAPKPLTSPPGPSRTLDELVQAGVIPQHLADALGPNRMKQATIRPAAWIAAGTTSAGEAHPPMLVPPVVQGDTVQHVAAVIQGTVACGAQCLTHLLKLYTDGVVQPVVGPDCHIPVHARATVLLDPKYSRYNKNPLYKGFALVIADAESKTLRVLSPVPDAPGVYEVLYHKSFVDMLRSKQRGKDAPAPEAASGALLLGGPIAHHRSEWETKRTKHCSPEATELFYELMTQPLPDMQLVLATKGREGWAAPGAPANDFDQWIAAATPASPAALHVVGTLVVHLPSSATGAERAAAQAALAAEASRRGELEAADAAAARAAAGAAMAATAPQLNKAMDALKTLAAGRKRGRSKEDARLAELGSAAHNAAKKLRSEGKLGEALAEVERAMTELQAPPP